LEQGSSIHQLQNKTTTNNNKTYNKTKKLLKFDYTTQKKNKKTIASKHKLYGNKNAKN
jgi:hypothetical protein